MTPPGTFATHWSRTLVLAILLVLAFGCGMQPKQRDEVWLPFPAFNNLNPAYWQGQHILAQGTIAEGLFGYAPDPKGLGGQKIVPLLAEQWSSNADATRWVIKMRRDKKWANGDPVTAHDFVRTYRYYASPDPSVKDIPYWAGPMQYVKNAWAVKRGAKPLSALGVSAEDDHTVVFELASPTYDFVGWLCVSAAVPLHMNTVEQHKSTWWKPEHYVGNGPYNVTKLVPDEECVLTRNHNYVGDHGNVERVVLKFGGLGLQSYQAGELDFAFVSNVGELRYVQRNAAMRATFHETLADLGWSGYQVARSQSPVLDDPRLRQAFAISIDRATLARTVMGNRVFAADRYWDPTSIIGKDLKSIPYDPAQGRRLMAEAGYPQGKGLPQLFFYITGPSNPVAEYVVKEWEKNLGVVVQIDNIENGMYWSNYVWGDNLPEVKPGFTVMGAPVNQFSAPQLLKNTDHTLWKYAFPAEVRKAVYDIGTVKYREVRSWKGGANAKDWEAITQELGRLQETQNRMLAMEPDPNWRADWLRAPTWQDSLSDVRARWDAAQTDAERTSFWRDAWAILIGQDAWQHQYLGMTDAGKAAWRARLAMTRTSIERAMTMAYEPMQMLQDQYYMVPLAIEKIQYVENPRLTGLQIYKFAWGPFPFNFKYLNLKP